MARACFPIETVLQGLYCGVAIGLANGQSPMLLLSHLSENLTRPRLKTTKTTAWGDTVGMERVCRKWNRTHNCVWGKHDNHRIMAHGSPYVVHIRPTRSGGLLRSHPFISGQSTTIDIDYSTRLRYFRGRRSKYRLVRQITVSDLNEWSS